MGMDTYHVFLRSGYSLALLATGNGTANGILRLFDLFDVLGRQMAIGPVIRFVGVVIAWRLDAPLVVFVIIWAVAAASEDLYLSWRGSREYHPRIGPPPDGEVVGDSRFSEFSGLKSFLWVTYWQSNMDLVRKHLSTLLEIGRASCRERVCQYV